jgi:hypothetical protein
LRLAYRLGSSLKTSQKIVDKEAKTQATVYRPAVHHAAQSWMRLITDQLDDQTQESKAMQLKDVVRYAEPNKYKASWTDDTRPLSGEDVEQVKELVRAGLIRENMECQNMLWPARFKTVSTRKGAQNAVWNREPIWDWAKVSVRGQSRRFFSICNWPVHLQSKETREKIKQSGPVINFDCEPAPALPSTSEPQAEMEPLFDPRMDGIKYGPHEFGMEDIPLQECIIREQPDRDIMKGEPVNRCCPPLMNSLC